MYSIGAQNQIQTEAMFAHFQTDKLKRNFTIDLTKEMMSKVKSISKLNDLYGGDLCELTKIMVDLIEFSLNNTNYSSSYSNADQLTQVFEWAWLKF